MTNRVPTRLRFSLHALFILLLSVHPGIAQTVVRGLSDDLFPSGRIVVSSANSRRVQVQTVEKPAVELLVDTGPGSTSSGSGVALFASGSTFCSPQPACAASFQFLAGQFVLTTAATLDSVEGWMSVSRGGSIDVKIRVNQNNVPGAVLFSKTYTLGSHANGWTPFSNYVTDLAAGTYWLTFEPVAGSQFDGGMVGNAPNPLASYAFFNEPPTKNWTNLSSRALGMRISGTRTAVPAFGTAVHVLRKGEFENLFDHINGGTSILHTQQFSGSSSGQALAYGTIKPDGLVVGSESSATQGTGRGIAFRAFRNNNPTSQTLIVKAVLHGKFRRAPFGLPTGLLVMGAAVHVFDTNVFRDRINASGLPAAEFLLNGHSFDAALDPLTAFANLRALFPGGLRGHSEVAQFGGPDGQLISVTLETKSITLAPQETFVVMFDLMTYSRASGGPCHLAICDPVGYGSVDFADSLLPADNLFVGTDGNAVPGIEAVSPEAPPPPPPTKLSLTQSSPAGALGTAHTVTALVKTAQDARLADTVVTFEVTSGPHAGLVGGGLTDENGEATFTYIGTAGTGTDNIRALVGTLESNAVQKNWQATGIVSFGQSNYTVQEDGTGVSITVARSGSATAAGTVDYATANLTSSDRADYTPLVGTLFFAPGETTKTFTVPINEDAFVEDAETVQLTLSNATGDAVIGQPSSATLTINDDAPETNGNPNDDPAQFVRQQYHDFLNREPDAAGLQFWISQITECEQQPEAERQACREVRRINVSAAFFLSIEFQETGYLAYRTYKTAYGDAISPNVSVPVPIVRLREFLAGTQAIGRAVQVGIGEWQEQLEANKVSFMNKFVRDPRFLSAYPMGLTAEQFVDQLNQKAGGVLSGLERDQLVAELSAQTDVIQGRAAVLRKVADDPDLRQRELNRAFVLLQYYGYLRRNPDDPQDADFSGWEFWLNKLNNFNGNFVAAEMVKAFLTSGEYRHRFGP